MIYGPKHDNPILYIFFMTPVTWKGGKKINIFSSVENVLEGRDPKIIGIYILKDLSLSIYKMLMFYDYIYIYIY